MRAVGLLPLALLLAACGQPAAAGQATAAHAAPVSSARPAPPPNMAVSEPTIRPAQLDTGGPPGPPAAFPSHGSPPVRLRIPAIGVDSSLGRLGLNSDG